MENALFFYKSQPDPSCQIRKISKIAFHFYLRYAIIDIAKHNANDMQMCLEESQ